jgi:hypothetical protein
MARKNTQKRLLAGMLKSFCGFRTCPIRNYFFWPIRVVINWRIWRMIWSVLTL